MDGTIIGQGSFTVGASVVNQYIPIPSGADWMRVVNYTQAGTIGGAAAAGNEFYWQRGMAPGASFVKYYTDGSAVLNGDTIAAGGFTLYDPSGQTPGALPLEGTSIVTTAITNVVRPVVSTANTAGVSVGSIVRLAKVGTDTEMAGPVLGIDFSVGAVTANTSFTLLPASAALANAVGLTTGTGHYRLVNYNPLFYPRTRTITNITQAVNGQVSTSIPHGLTPGQEIRFNIPAESGMTQLNPQILNNYYPLGSSAAAIVQTVVDDWNFTININTASYTAFSFPTVAQQPSSFPEVTPFGEDTATALASSGNQVPMIGGVPIYNANSGILADSLVNTGFLGMILGTGGLGTISATAITGPAGTAAADVVYWVAGKSTYGGQ